MTWCAIGGERRANRHTGPGKLKKGCDMARMIPVRGVGIDLDHLVTFSRFKLVAGSRGEVVVALSSHAQLESVGMWCVSVTLLYPVKCGGCFTWW